MVKKSMRNKKIDSDRHVPPSNLHTGAPCFCSEIGIDYRGHGYLIVSARANPVNCKSGLPSPFNTHNKQYTQQTAHTVS